MSLHAEDVDDDPEMTRLLLEAYARGEREASEAHEKRVAAQIAALPPPQDIEEVAALQRAVQLCLDNGPGKLPGKSAERLWCPHHRQACYCRVRNVRVVPSVEC